MQAWFGATRLPDTRVAGARHGFLARTRERSRCVAVDRDRMGVPVAVRCLARRGAAVRKWRKLRGSGGGMCPALRIRFLTQVGGPSASAISQKGRYVHRARGLIQHANGFALPSRSRRTRVALALDKTVNQISGQLVRCRYVQFLRFPNVSTNQVGSGGGQGTGAAIVVH